MWRVPLYLFLSIAFLLSIAGSYIYQNVRSEAGSAMHLFSLCMITRWGQQSHSFVNVEVGSDIFTLRVFFSLSQAIFFAA